jgi:hypothetical protein
MSVSTFSRADAPSRDHDTDLNAAFNYVRQLCSQKFFGTVVFSIQSGILSTVRRDEVMKPENLTNHLTAASRGTTNGNRNQ